MGAGAGHRDVLARPAIGAELVLGETDRLHEVVDRLECKRRKGQFRRLWTARISAAVRPLGLTYSRFMEGLKAANVDLDRKSLAELAVANPEGFKAVFELAKKAIDAKAGATLAK